MIFNGDADMTWLTVIIGNTAPPESFQKYFDDSLNFRRLLLRILVVFSSQGVKTTRLEVIVCYLGYFDDCCEKFAAQDKPVYIMGDFKTEKSLYSHNVLLSLQSYYLNPTVDRVRTLFEQKIQGLSRKHLSFFKDSFSAKKSLETKSFLVLPQHE